MNSPSAKEIINNLYELLIEINLASDSMPEYELPPDKEEQMVQGHLKHIRRLKAQYKAKKQREDLISIITDFRQLKDEGIQKLERFLSPKQKKEYASLFRKFSSLSKQDEQDILEDAQILQMIQLLKKKLDEDSSN